MPSNKPSLISIVDDYGNPLFKSNPVNKVNDSALQKGKPDLGFTPPSDFGNVTGVELNHSAGKATDTNQKNFTNEIYESSFNYNDGSVNFKHVLDHKVIPIPAGLTATSYTTPDPYLGSFVATSGDNEDPTMLGYDIMIDYTTSPLFNGAVEDFINQFPNTAEISSRLQTITDFKTQFYKFFKTTAPNSSLSALSADPNVALEPKAYYFKKIQGLDRLTESNTSDDVKKSFVDYGVDYIKIQLNEDVTQNMGYLASLYKALSWSRINGKQVIPANLLRFNLILTITEIRNYNRVIKNTQSELNVIADLISRYEYSLYECQLFFPNLPHGENLDLSAPAAVDFYEFQFNYKFSTMRFVKFDPKAIDSKNFSVGGNSVLSFDNEYANIYQVTPKNGELVKVDSTIELRKSGAYYRYLTKISKNPQNPNTEAGNNSITQKAEEKSLFKQNLERLGGDLKRAAINEVNRRVVTQFKLLNRTLDNIRDAIPMAGRMSAPTNVYTGEQLSLSTDVQNAIRNFAGRSLKNLFGGK